MPLGQVSLQAVVSGAWLVLLVAGIDLSFAVARLSLAAFRPLLLTDEHISLRATRRLTMVPGASPVLAGVLGVLWLWGMLRVDPSFFGLVGRGA